MWLLALGGMGIGHWATYVLARPDEHARDALLAVTGHGLWGPFALTAAMCVFAAAAAVAFVRILVRARPASRDVYKHGAPLVLLQCGGFVAVEVIERALAGAHDGDLWGGGLLVVGLIVQAATACISLAAGAFLSSIVGAVRSSPSLFPSPRLRPQFILAGAPAVVVQPDRFGTPRLRAPPGGTHRKESTG